MLRHFAQVAPVVAQRQQQGRQLQRATGQRQDQQGVIEAEAVRQQARQHGSWHGAEQMQGDDGAGGGKRTEGRMHEFLRHRQRSRAGGRDDKSARDHEAVLPCQAMHDTESAAQHDGGGQRGGDGEQQLGQFIAAVVVVHDPAPQRHADDRQQHHAAGHEGRLLHRDVMEAVQVGGEEKHGRYPLQGAHGGAQVGEHQRGRAGDDGQATAQCRLATGAGGGVAHADGLVILTAVQPHGDQQAGQGHDAQRVAPAVVRGDIAAQRHAQRHADRLRGGEQTEGQLAPALGKGGADPGVGDGRVARFARSHQGAAGGQLRHAARQAAGGRRQAPDDAHDAGRLDAAPALDGDRGGERAQHHAQGQDGAEHAGRGICDVPLGLDGRDQRGKDHAVGEVEHHQ